MIDPFARREVGGKLPFTRNPPGGNDPPSLPLLLAVILILPAWSWSG